jgi:anti-sigma factor RsiW
MAEVFPLRPSEHDAVQQLLPWHVNGTLTAGESTRVEAHLAQCEECRGDLATERVLAREVALLPLDVDEGWQAMSLRLGEARGGNHVRHVPLLRRPVPAGWAVGGAIAASLALTLAATSLQRPAASGHTFQTLGSPGADATGQVVVLFRPDTTEQQMRTILDAERARVIDGPTAAGAYVLRLDGRDAGEAIEALRRSSQIILAEPIASDGRP